MNILINIGMYLVYALFVLGILAAVGFSIYQFIGNVKQSKTALYGILALVVIFLIAYFTASSTDVSAAVVEKAGLSRGGVKMLGAGMNVIYILVVVTLGSLIGFEVARAFKK